ncbi:MAG: ABC transporter ATP-binding protein [Bacteroidales bacterium]|nr:ABC transporter ATP-binding protein [Bacteroidales bacterium]MCI1732885.1 ABC transporter ATP-binding protein [Bacteroidales bacterium]
MIECKNICKSYGKIQVLRGLNFSADKGNIVSIVGASGAGKTTLLQILGTILAPDSGQVLIDGTDVFALSSNELAEFRNKKIGFVFQFHHLLPEFTAVENVMMPALILKSEHNGNAMSYKEIKSKAISILAELGLAGKEDSRPSEMSGGEQQRVAIARALMNDPDIIFADEPSGNLDSKTKQELHDLFFKLRDAHGQTIIIVTHDMSMAERSDKILEIKDGQFVEQQEASLLGN